MIILVIALSCIYVWKSIQDDMHLHLEDKNGDDKTLCIMKDEDIEKCTEDYIAFGHTIFSTGLNASGVKGEYEDLDNEYTNFDIKLLSGLYIANVYLGEGEMVSYQINSEVEKGNFKIMITDENKKILYEIPIDQETEISFLAEKGKMYYVKFAAESAKFEAELWRKK